MSDGHCQGDALILGAGGSARAVAYALLYAGFEITIAARRLQQAEEIQRHFPAFRNRIAPIDLGSLADLVGSHNLIVNTTPVGMRPNIHASPWPAGVPFPEDAAIYDLVYNPIETMLVREAQAAGRKAVNGLGMLVEQAALAFERWTGLVAPRDAMMAAVYE
jgi:shikimate dehydrogenase